MVMTSDETQIQILANWPMSHAKRVIRDNWKNPEYHVVAAIRCMSADRHKPSKQTTVLDKSSQPCGTFNEINSNEMCKRCC